MAESLFEKALNLYVANQNNDEFFDVYQDMFGGQEKFNGIYNSMYSMARDGMPQEIVDTFVGNLFIGFLMGKIYSEEKKNSNS